MKKIAALIILTSLFGAAQAQPYQHQELPAGYSWEAAQFKGSDVTDQIQDKLDAHGDRFDDVSVDVDDRGLATIRGTVRSPADRDLVNSMVSSHPRVNGVTNELTYPDNSYGKVDPDPEPNVGQGGSGERMTPSIPFVENERRAVGK